VAGRLDAQQRFTVLWRAHHGAVLRYARRRTGAESAADVVSETFLVAWRRLGEVPANPEQALPWLYGVARRVLCNLERSRARGDRLSARLAHAGEGTGAEADVAEGVVERDRFVAALSQLPGPDREVLRLIGWELLGVGQAAAVMGCSRAALVARLHRARRRLERALDAGDDPRDDLGDAATARGERPLSIGR
jgi:RNA polymerase sigma-70 factor, ECF subfamily